MRLVPGLTALPWRAKCSVMGMEDRRVGGRSDSGGAVMGVGMCVKGMSWR
jgi:hypothetical protein